MAAFIFGQGLQPLLDCLSYVLSCAHPKSELVGKEFLSESFCVRCGLQSLQDLVNLVGVRVLCQLLCSCSR